VKIVFGTEDGGMEKESTYDVVQTTGRGSDVDRKKKGNIVKRMR
jgi:hypothetical protein